MNNKELIASELAKVIDSLDQDAILNLLEQPKSSDLGDIAFPAFSLAKVERKAPQAIAADIAEKIIFTGMIDEYFGYRLGALEYRSVRFETEVLDCENYQGNAVVNYTEREVPYTRIIEHKHFEFGRQEKTVISREYSSEWSVGMEPYYPVNDEKNTALYQAYRELAEKEENVIFGGRLGDYKYYDMDKVVAAALERLEEL